jgi:ribosomal protein L11 methyltransferase
MPGSYVELTVTSTEPLGEQVVGLIAQLGFEGLWEDGTSLKCYMRKERWDGDLLREVERVLRLATPSSRATIPDVSVRTIEEENWNAKWEETIKPIRVTDRIVIAPTWAGYQPSPQEILILIDPKMSFGTGYHESTRLALLLIQRHIRHRSAVLDVGTGTGVLAIAAVKLGARSAIGVDIDEWSFHNAVENAELNRVGDSVQIRRGDLSAVPDGQFDLIICNIQRNIIETMLPGLRTRLAPRGLLVLSGLLLSDGESIRRSLTATGLHASEELVENEWMALVAEGS